MAKRFDFALIADFIISECAKRESDRKDYEDQWKEIDRQIRMEPLTGHKLTRGRIDPDKDWMPEVELPLQAQTLEVLTADARRMLQPDSGPWFQANALVSDEYLDRHDLSAIIEGANDVPSHLDQDNVNKIVEGTVAYWERQYDFWGNLDKINGESFKYSLGIGRVRTVTKAVFRQSAKGVVKENARIPILLPLSIKQVYPDTSKAHLLNEGYSVGGLTISKAPRKLKDIQKAAKMGSTDPKKETGGWIPKNLAGLEGDKNGDVEIIEAEGDLILPKRTKGYLLIPNSIITVVKARKGGKDASAVIRYRITEEANSIIQFPYHAEHIDDPYGGSPLMKGFPIQKSASEAFLQTIMSAQLNTRPPIQYDDTDMALKAQGGPNIWPGAQNPTMAPILPIEFGDPAALFQMYIGLVQQYSDVTGVNAPRLGAQTVSHTTAFAKDAELQRGQSRTVDYTKATLSGPLSQYLNTAYQIGRKTFQSDSIFIEPYGGYVRVSKDLLPEKVYFQAFGAGGPLEEQAKQQQKLAAMQQAMALEQFKVMAAQGIKPTVDIKKAQEQILRDGGWTDVEAIMATDVESQPIESPPQTAPGEALQALGEQIA